MNEIIAESFLITGANTGIGKELAKQLALRPKTRKVYLGSRNSEKGAVAKSDLERTTGRSIFEVINIDVDDFRSVNSAIQALAEPIDFLVMNAGGSGGSKPMELTESGVTRIFSSNVLGHAALLDGLIKEKKLGKGAIFAGSEAARGVPIMGMKQPTFSSASVEEFKSVCDGHFFDGKTFDPKLAYGQVKFIGALWIAEAAKKFPHLRLITMSPGNTSGTSVLRDLPLPARIIIRYFMMPVLFPLIGQAHSLMDGAKRHIDAIFNPSLLSGCFYASKKGYLSGSVVNQALIDPTFSDERAQRNAYEAVHAYITDRKFKA